MKLCHSRGLHQTFSYGTSLWYHLLHILPLKKYCFFCDFDIIAMKCASQPLGHYQDKVQHIHSIQTLTPFRPTPLHQLRQLGIPSVQWRTHLFCKKDWNKSGCLQYSTQDYHDNMLAPLCSQASFYLTTCCFLTFILETAPCCSWWMEEKFVGGKPNTMSQRC